MKELNIYDARQRPSHPALESVHHAHRTGGALAEPHQAAGSDGRCECIAPAIDLSLTWEGPVYPDRTIPGTEQDASWRRNA